MVGQRGIEVKYQRKRDIFGHFREILVEICQIASKFITSHEILMYFNKIYQNSSRLVKFNQNSSNPIEIQ